MTATDANASDLHTYSLVTGEGDTDNNSFSIVNGQLRSNAILDFEDQANHTIRVRATDSFGLFFERAFTISVTDVNEAASTITLTPSHLANGMPSGTVVGSFANNDPDTNNTFTYSLVSGTGDTDNGSFTISGNKLISSVAVNQAAQSSYSVRVRVVDNAGLSAEQVLTITVTDANVAPTAIGLGTSSIAENQPIGTVVGLFTTTDANLSDTHDYEFVSGTGDEDNSKFTISGNQLRTGSLLDFESKNAYSIRVRSIDGGGLTVESTFAIAIVNQNEAPSALALSSNSIAMGQPVNTVVGSLTSTDSDVGDTFTYTLVEGEGDTDNSAFEIQNGAIVSKSIFDQAIQDMYSVRVRTQDVGGLGFEQMLSILVDEQNVAPTAILLSSSMVASNAPAGTLVGGLTTDDDNASDEHIYTLVEGSGDTDNALFTIDGGNLRLTGALDDNTPNTLSVRVRSQDRYGLFIEETLVITVENPLI